MCKRFAAAWVANGRNGTRAYMVIFPRCAPRSANSHAGEWLAKPEVQTEIARLTAEAWGREHMDATEVLARMARVARQDIRDYYWRPGELDRNGNPTVIGQRKELAELTDIQAESVKGFKYTNDGRLIQELYDKTAQWANIAKHLKLLTDRVDLNLTMSLEDMIQKSYQGPQSDE